MSNITQAREALVSRILEGKAEASSAQRRAAFVNAVADGPLRTLVDKVARHAHQVTDEDIAAARASGLTENEIYELVVCAAVGAAGRQLDAGLAALAAAVGEK
ncbi:MAG TPA: hypothetical protein VGL61_09445 [Kofleriaceae bacterium]|jgi:alkylhydroperoxidase family enzyme